MPIKILFLVIALLLTGCIGSDEITVSYVLICNDKYQDGRCAGQEYMGNPTSYRINLARNEVVTFVHGINDTPTTLVNCSILDAGNWECEYSDGLGKEKMIDGLLQNPPPTMKYVHRWDFDYIKAQVSRIRNKL